MFYLQGVLLKAAAVFSNLNISFPFSSLALLIFFFLKELQSEPGLFNLQRGNVLVEFILPKTSNYLLLISCFPKPSDMKQKLGNLRGTTIQAGSLRRIPCRTCWL